MRILFTTLGAFLHYAIGYMLLPAVAFGLRDWRPLIFTLACFSPLLFPIWWFISESPRWLLSQGRVKECEEILRHAARKNGVTPPEPIFMESENLPRRVILSTCWIIGGGLLFFIQLIPEHLSEVAIFLEMVGKFCFTMSFCVVYMYTAEVYPTVVRNIGAGICSSASRIGSITTPYVLYLGKYNLFLPYIILGSLTLGCCSVNLFLPETFNRTLPETEEQMQKFRGFNKCTKVAGSDEQEKCTELPQEVILAEDKF
ncbi:hypothetical protein SKAU_G00227870 [Synaphobranchus kaupii]|uniref:Uncharacterized protein n=1 Tax=Synaphobranchus kaupii TaxID=118154 RepID=A0A9Q1IT18_SYNKA|nr:hypothetical protein SKAU_G00227870 [Synaphobranchus kaupii]